MKCLPTSRALALGALGLMFAAAPTPARAADNGPTEWTIGFNDDVVNDATGSEPDSVRLDWSGGVSPADSTKLVMKLERAGSIIATDPSGSRNGTYVSVPDLRAGDVATFFDKVTGVTLAQVIYDGRPAFDATTCNGSVAFTGLRTAAAPIDEVRGFSWVFHSHVDMYGGKDEGWDRKDWNTGTVNTLVGDAFGGTFERAVAAGTYITAESHHPLSAQITVEQRVTQLVGACAPPPPPPAPPADTSAPSAGLTAPSAKQLRKLKIKSLTSGIKLSIKPNEASTVTAQLLLKTSKKKPTKVLTTTVTSAAAGVDTPFKVTLPKKVKKALKGLPGSAKLSIHVTVSDTAGNVTTLPDVTFKVPTR